MKSRVRLDGEGINAIDIGQIDETGDYEAKDDVGKQGRELEGRCGASGSFESKERQHRDGVTSKDKHMPGETDRISEQTECNKQRD